MEITDVEPDNIAVIRDFLGSEILEEILQTQNARNPPFFFALMYENQQITHPFFILLGRNTVLHTVRVCCYVIE